MSFRGIADVLGQGLWEVELKKARRLWEKHEAGGPQVITVAYRRVGSRAAWAACASLHVPIKVAFVVCVSDRSETLPSTRLPRTLAPHFHFLISLTFPFSTPIGNLNETRAFHLERDRVSIPATWGVILTWTRVLEPPSHPPGVTFPSVKRWLPHAPAPAATTPIHRWRMPLSRSSSYRWTLW